ncbi:hypothetical protein ANCDUO_25471, partial [Ancylostoma duodenale]
MWRVKVPGHHNCQEMQEITVCLRNIGSGIATYGELRTSCHVGDIGRKDLCAKGVVSALDTATRIAYEEYNPCLFIQHEGGTYHSFTTFSEGVDAYYAVLDAQKQQQAALKIEKEAMKRLENVRKDQYRRILELEYSREEKMLMADLIIHNKALVDSAIQVICRALAQKTSWEDVERMHLEAIHKGDYVAR